MRSIRVLASSRSNAVRGLELPALDGFQGFAQTGPHQTQLFVGDANERVVTTVHEFHEWNGGTPR